MDNVPDRKSPKDLVLGVARNRPHFLLKPDGLPTYHLANVVDDLEMDVTHVL